MVNNEKIKFQLSKLDVELFENSDKIIEVDGKEYSIGGDIIVAVDGMDVRKIDDILVHLQRVKTVGDEMNLEILRDGRTTNVTIILQERPN